MKNYELLEHTADIRIRVRGEDLKALFKNAALAMFGIIAEPRTKNYEPRTKNKYIIRQSADNLEELFVNWLNELLSLSAIKEKIFCEFRFRHLDEKGLEVGISGCPFADYRINTEIKAATYHQLKIEKTKGGFQAEVIFDV